MNITFRTKDFFFDRKVVLDHFGKSGKVTLKALSRAGAFVRTRARSMLRRRKRVAAAGSPPSVHTSDTTITLKNIQFAYDFSSNSVVVGPVLLNGAKRGRVPAPQLLEFGGSVPANGKVIYVTRAAGRDAQGRFVSNGKDRIALTGNMNYKPHPWMGPALEAERENLPRHWQASVRGAS